MSKSVDPENNEATERKEGKTNVVNADIQSLPHDEEPRDVQELTTYIQSMLQQMQDRFQTMSEAIIGRIDEMGERIDDLEHNINDLIVHTAAPGNEQSEQHNSSANKSLNETNSSSELNK